MTDSKTWSLGDLAPLAAHLPPIYAELLCESLALRPGQRVLDAAAGTGPTAIAAARRFCDVTAADFVPGSLATARRLAEGEGLAVETREADVQELPFDDDTFDAAASTFGAMFAPDQERTASELVRVVRRGGVIGLTAWTPDGVIGDYVRAIAKHAPPPPLRRRSPFEWGTEARVDELFAGSADSIDYVHRAQPFRFPSAGFAIDYFNEWYGPARAVWEHLDVASRPALRADAAAAWQAHNEADDGTLVVFADYLECVVRLHV